MTPVEINQTLTNKFANKIVEAKSDPPENYIHILPQDVPEVISYLKNDPALKMDYLCCLSGVDWLKENKMEVVYHLSSISLHHKIAVHTFIDRNDPKIPSITYLYGAANWHERETFDLLGINFEGHPDLRRILLPDDWVGNPLRKDYQFPEEYHGIKWA
jgi:NADH-quinone oxidoreductase subunit C